MAAWRLLSSLSDRKIETNPIPCPEPSSRRRAVLFWSHSYLSPNVPARCPQRGDAGTAGLPLTRPRALLRSVDRHARNHDRVATVVASMNELFLETPPLGEGCVVY
ncbi:excinuclease ATPase subunit [Anopheles sinensis]|uniref:Excinuclease ATPase subunit n=1 Tax=Anopheles sinensis TaxID=74873 RepID=A0A084VHJ8_ANOSI|nr:excinuclease ATPase subunit [Anopheles sinensis]